MPKTTSNGDQIKPELLPLDLGGGDIQFVKRSDYAKGTAERFSLKYKADIKRDHVTSILDAIDNGAKELDGDQPDEIHKLFALVNEDYTAGVEEVQRLAREKAEAEEKAKAEAEEKAKKEEELFLSIKDKDPSLGDLMGKFDTGNMDRFLVKDGVSDAEVLGALSAGLQMDNFTAWMRGDLVAELEKRGQLNVVAKLAESRGVPYSGLYNDCKTAKAIPPEQRAKGVSFTIYREIANAKFSDKKQEEGKAALLAEVAEGKHTTQSVREEVRKIQGKSKPEAVAPEENEKKEFIVYDPNADLANAITVHTGFPKQAAKDGCMVIDPKTLKKFAKNGFQKSAEKRWEEIMKAPEPEKEGDSKEAVAAAPAKKGSKKSAK